MRSPAPRCRRPLRTKALAVLVAFAATACAGSAGRNATTAAGPAPGAQTSPSGEAPAPDAGAPADPAGGEAPAAPDGSGAVASETPASGAPAGSGGAAASARTTTANSGPVAALNRSSSPSPVGANPSGRSAAARSSSAGASSAGGSSSSAGSGGRATAPPGPAPLPGGGTTTGVTKDTLTLGLMYSKTGFYAGLTRNFPIAVQAALDEAGPINGRRVALKLYDDGSQNASTIQLEEKRAKEEVFAMMSVVSESNVVLAPLADQHKLPVILGNMDEKVARPLTYAFPVYAYWARQATILPSFIKNVLGGGGKKIGIVYEGTSTAIDAKNAFRNKAKELNLNVIFEQPIAVSQTACANEVANLQSHGVELVFMMNGPLGAICMLRDARALGYKPVWTGVGVSWSFNVVARASGGAADGIRTIGTTTTLETPAGRHYSELIRRVAPNSGGDDDDVTMLAYALALTTIEGLRRAGPNLTREGFVQTMESKMSGYDSGYLPPPTFGPGNRSGPMAVGIAACCTNGRWTTPTQGWRASF